MAQTSRTSCAHNAMGQVLVPGVSIACRKCGAQIRPTPRAVNAGGQLVVSEAQVDALYPGDSRTADANYIFAK